MPKVLRNKDASEDAVTRKRPKVQRHDPMARPDLERAIGGEEIKPMQPKKNVRKPVKKRIYQKMKRVDREEAAGDDEIEDIAEEKVVRQAQLQQLEMRADEERDGDGAMEDGGSGAEDDLEYDSDDASVYTATSGVDDYEAYVREEQQISAEEEEAFRLFLDPAAATKKVRTIGDIIAEKMEASAAAGGGDEDMEEEEEEGYHDVDPKVETVYRGVGRLLTRYKSGKLPKALKIVPSLSNWEQILWITEPDRWSNHAYYACTRIFASCLQDPMAQRFYNLVLLPRVVDDLRRNKRLNYHLYQALKKALYKPAAFYKGIVLPRCESGACTLREATVLCSVVKKVSVPVLHSSAALLKLCMHKQYNGSQSIFIRSLLDKKYALPFRVIDAVVEHFVAFRADRREMPVKWHQALLVLAQRYKNDISPQQREALKEVMRIHSHYRVTPEIRRELFSVTMPSAGGGTSAARSTTAQRLDALLPSR